MANRQTLAACLASLRMEIHLLREVCEITTRNIEASDKTHGKVSQAAMDALPSLRRRSMGSERWVRTCSRTVLKGSIQ